MSLASKLATLLVSQTALSSAFVPPAGSLIAYAGTSAPAGWLLCAGQEVSRTTYAALDAVLTTTYGAYTNGSGGAGTTHFRLPDLRGRVPAGKDNMGGTAATRLTTAGSGVDGVTLGANGGTQSHALTESQMPSHTHSYVGGANAAGSGTVGAAGQSANGYTMSTLSAGSGQAHNNTQPTIVLNYLVKT